MHRWLKRSRGEVGLGLTQNSRVSRRWPAAGLGTRAITIMSRWMNSPDECRRRNRRRRGRRGSRRLVTSSTTSGYSRAKLSQLRCEYRGRGEGRDHQTHASRRPVAQPGNQVDRLPNIAERRAEPREQLCARLVGQRCGSCVRATGYRIVLPAPEIAWLSAEGVTPSRLAARVKLRSSAPRGTPRGRSSSSRTICERYSLTLVDCSRYCRAVRPVTIDAMDIKRAGSQPSSKGPPDWFTGTVRIDPLFQAPACSEHHNQSLAPGMRSHAVERAPAEGDAGAGARRIGRLKSGSMRTVP